MHTSLSFSISLNNSTLLFLLGKFDHKCPYLFWLQFDIINVHSLNLLDDLLLLINIPPQPLHVGQRHVAVQRSLRDPGGGAEGGEDLRSAANRLIGCTITEKAPTRAFPWLKAPTSAFTFKTLLRHYAKRALTPRSLNVKLGPRHKSQKGRAGWLA